MAGDEGGTDGGLRELTVDNALAKSYVKASGEAGLQPNHLVVQSLTEAAEAGQPIFPLDAPGNDPRVFRSRLGDAEMVVLSHVLGAALPYLSRLDLSYNLLSDEGAVTLAEGLLGRRAGSLRSVVLRGNSIGPRGCDALSVSLKECPQLVRLDVALNPLGRDGGLMFVELVQGCPELLEINLADTEIDIDVIVAMAAVLLTGVPKLKYCNLENPRIQTRQEEHTVHIGRMLRVNVGLSEIYLGKHRMRDEGVRQLVSFLLENKTLRVLDLRCNELGAEGACHLGTLLGSDCQLQRLNLDANRIGEKDNVNGAQALADALLNNRMLNHLSLNHNSLCGEALAVLGQAIDQSGTLETIELFHNNWDQASSYKFHQIFRDRSRIQPLKADFKTDEVDLRIDVCQLQDFKSSQ
eukprot:TRINITY_DN31262_c0_g1_i1.p1 TRINITY_DN31262_c0_g1~~TRINITY_DN31262_c0_g1_i1.p1  ORF type:complete len:430 (-),score=57.36 TRINITY_DN31262_c0_g1_i1:58-1284(-)